MQNKKIKSTIALCFLSVLFIAYARYFVDKCTNTKIYMGKWKVKELLLECDRAVAYYHPNHYLGRTIVLDEKFVEKSIWYWPFKPNSIRKEYESAEICRVDVENIKFEVFKSSEIKEFYDRKYVTLLEYYETEEKDYPTNCFIILDKNHLVCVWLGGYYLLEPYMYCNPKVNRENLSGEWIIESLDSYDNSYDGTREDIEDVKRFFNPDDRPEIDVLVGSDFNPREWLGKKINICDERIIINEQEYEVNSIDEKEICRVDFESDYGIHDGLSLYDDVLKVCYLYGDNVEIPIVLVDKEHMIIHIGQGWFMLKREKL